jgi:uncharacterized lipoprotein YehR (DUF1307 family)
MKNMAKLIGITALAAVIVFSMAACGDGGGGTTKKETPPVAKVLGITDIPDENAAYAHNLVMPVANLTVMYDENTPKLLPLRGEVFQKASFGVVYWFRTAT